jgi:putative ABC transporter, ATP-binding protein
MEIFIKNIGKVREANIKINGITVIAGENDTGKSTISKSLFTVFNSFYNIDKKITEQQKDIIKFTIAKNFSDNLEFIKSIVFKNNFEDTFNINQLINEIIENSEIYKYNEVNLKNKVVEYSQKYNLNFTKDEDINEITEKIKEILNIPNAETEKSILNKNLNVEFNKQINNIFSDEEGIIEIKIKDKKIKIEIFENEIKNIEKPSKININIESLYLDDPFIIDNNFYDNNPSNHTEFLRYRLFSKIEDKTNNIGKIIITKKLENIYKKLNNVCSGNIIESNKNTNDFSYKLNNKELDIKNLSAGLKTFVILKTLLEKGILEENGIIILDEPEIHLHPAWQVIFAELIVLIQKEFNMHILLNTHSPYFLNAIEIYSKKHNIEKKCSFYSAYLSGQFSEFEDVTNNIEEIYSKLARPFQDLENERYSDD